MKLQYISKVAKLLENSLPAIVTKEELMNHYLHKVKIGTMTEMNITVINLVQAANLAGKQVRGKSKLEVNVSNMDQWRYMSEEVVAIPNRLGFKERMYNNKDDIVKAYESGVTTKELADAWNCSLGTMNTYLKKFGAEIRRCGRNTLRQSTNAVPGETGKKRRRKQRAE